MLQNIVGKQLTSPRIQENPCGKYHSIAVVSPRPPYTLHWKQRGETEKKKKNKRKPNPKEPYPQIREAHWLNVVLGPYWHSDSVRPIVTRHFRDTWGKAESSEVLADDGDISQTHVALCPLKSLPCQRGPSEGEGRCRKQERQKCCYQLKLNWG